MSQENTGKVQAQHATCAIIYLHIIQNGKPTNKSRMFIN